MIRKRIALGRVKAVRPYPVVVAWLESRRLSDRSQYFYSKIVSAAIRDLFNGQPELFDIEVAEKHICSKYSRTVQYTYLAAMRSFAEFQSQEKP